MGLSPHFSHMFDGETGDSHNGAGLKAKDARWRSDTVFVTGGAILVPGKDAQAFFRRRISRYAEDRARGGRSLGRKAPAGR